jgi:hypothetical protein
VSRLLHGVTTCAAPCCCGPMAGCVVLLTPGWSDSAVALYANTAATTLCGCVCALVLIRFWCLLPACSFGAYIILSAATCLALDWVTGPQKVAHVPDAKQLELVREAAEQRRAEAQLQLLQRHQEAAAKATGMSRLSKATRRNSHAAGGTTANGSSTTASSCVSSLTGSPRHYNGAGAAAGDTGSTYRGSIEGSGWRASLAGAPKRSALAVCCAFVSDLQTFVPCQPAALE